MLEKIYIKNYVLIKELTIPFQANFNVLTGETGAGKSIILGALSLILGERADTNTLFDSQEKCIIEGHFDIKKVPGCLAFLAAHDLDQEQHTIIRREISPQGKSRAFINDSPVNLQVLHAFTSQLVDLHRQFDNLAVRDQTFSFEILDALAHHKETLDTYKLAYKHHVQLEQSYQDLISNKAKAQQDLDYKKYLLEELEGYDAQPQELELLAEKVQTLAHADEIRQNIQSMVYGLQEEEQAIIQQLRRMLQTLQQTEKLDPSLAPLSTRLSSSYEELKDLSKELEQHLTGIESNPEELFNTQERLDTGYKLLKKHNVLQTQELIDLQLQLHKEIGKVANIDEEIALLEQQIKASQAEVLLLAKAISQQRLLAAAPFEAKVTESIRLMGMKNAHFKVSIETLEQPNTMGIDVVQFIIDSNNSGRYAPIQKSASGGELSRIMLAIKTITAQDIALPTMIFDEVDTGISGESAKQVGDLMKELGNFHQIICITHQPQVAAKAHHHYFVYKKENDLQQVETAIALLNESQRVQAIARMIGGDNLSEAALNNAKELMA